MHTKVRETELNQACSHCRRLVPLCSYFDISKYGRDYGFLLIAIREISRSYIDADCFYLIFVLLDSALFEVRMINLIVSTFINKFWIVIFSHCSPPSIEEKIEKERYLRKTLMFHLHYFIFF